jgi:tetratricopeptide (TPR) repeat protein
MRAPNLDILISLLLIVLTAAAFSPVLNNDFVNYDDPLYVTKNSRVQEGLTPASLGWAWTTTSVANWHPLTWMSLELDYQIYGLNPRGYHLTNLLLHLANTVLLFWALLRLTGARWPSALVAALFAVHPLHVQAVAWIAERKEVLSALFGMLTLLAYSWYVKQPSVRSYVFVAGSLALGLLAKPMLVTMPFVLLLLDYWPLGRFSFGPQLRPTGNKSTRLAKGSTTRFAGITLTDSDRKVVLEKIPLLVIVAASCIMTVIAQRKGGAVSSLTGLSLWARCANAFVSYVRYLGSTFWPSGLVPFYPHPGEDIPVWQPALAALLLIGMTIFALRYARRHPYLPVGWFWYVGMLVPVVGFVQVGFQAGADRYTYLPLIGIFIMVSWALAEAAVRWNLQTAAYALAGCAVGACVLLSFFQARRWHDSIGLWQYTVRVTPRNAIAKVNLGTALEVAGQEEEAMRLYEEAVRDDPRTDLAHTNLGRLLASRGSLDAATEHFEAAIRLRPDSPLAHARFGVALASQGKIQEAVQHFQEAVRLDPEYGPAHTSLGSLLGRMHQLPEAIYHSREALRINPRDVEAHINLGAALESDGQLPESTEQYRSALRLDPGNANAHNNLGAVLDRQGDLRGAESEYRDAVQLDPDYVLARINLGGALERLGQPGQALEQYRKAMRVPPKEALEFLDLAGKFLRLGQKDEANSCFRKAVALEPRDLKYRLRFAQALELQGDTSGADAEYQESVRLDPQWPEKLNQEAWKLATRPDPTSRIGSVAVAWAQQVCQATHHSEARYVDTLAAAYAAAGQFPQAVTTARQALTLASTAQQPELAQQIQNRLRLYEKNQAYAENSKSETPSPK